MTNNQKNIERNIDKVEFTRETGVTPDVWHPINVAPIKLKELKDEIASLPESEKKRRAAEFIEKNKIPESKLDVVPLVVTGAAAAVTTGTLVEASKPGTLENMKLAVVGLWNRAGAFFEKQGGFMKDMWNEFRGWITSDLPTEKPKLFDSPIGWFKYTFLGFLKPEGSIVSQPSLADDTSTMTPPPGVRVERGLNSPEGVDENIVSKGVYLTSAKGLAIIHRNYLSKTIGEDNKDYNRSVVLNVFEEASFADLPYSKSVSLYEKYRTTPKNATALLSEIGIKSASIKPEHVVAALGLLIDSSLTTTELVQKSVGNQKNLSLKEIVIKNYQDFSLGNSLESMKISLTQNPTELAGNIFGPIEKKFDLINDESGKWNFSDPETRDMAQKIGLTPDVVTELSISNININTTSEADINNKDLTPATKEVLKKLYSFWKATKPSLVQNFSFGKNVEFQKFYDTADIKPKSLLSLYVLSGGDSHISDFSGMRKFAIYGVIRKSFFTGSQANLESGAELFNKSILELAGAFLKNSPEEINRMIDPKTKEVMQQVIASSGESLMEGGFNKASLAWKALPDGAKVGTCAGLAVGVYLLWQLRSLKFLGIGIGVGVIGVAASTYAAAIYQNLSPADQKKFPQEDIRSDLEKGFKDLSK